MDKYSSLEDNPARHLLLREPAPVTHEDDPHHLSAQQLYLCLARKGAGASIENWVGDIFVKQEEEEKLHIKKTSNQPPHLSAHWVLSS